MSYSAYTLYGPTDYSVTDQSQQYVYNQGQGWGVYAGGYAQPYSSGYVYNQGYGWGVYQGGYAQGQYQYVYNQGKGYGVYKGGYADPYAQRSSGGGAPSSGGGSSGGGGQQPQRQQPQQQQRPQIININNTTPRQTTIPRQPVISPIRRIAHAPILERSGSGQSGGNTGAIYNPALQRSGPGYAYTPAGQYANYNAPTILPYLLIGGAALAAYKLIK